MSNALDPAQNDKAMDYLRISVTRALFAGQNYLLIKTIKLCGWSVISHIVKALLRKCSEGLMRGLGYNLGCISWTK